MSSAEYGVANLLPPIGLVLGALLSAKLAARYSLISTIRKGVTIASIGSLLMSFATIIYLPALFSLFLPWLIIYFGLALILANAATTANEPHSQ
jgi:DHA1 family bicyclomycin/chloramphenicol resistance-like MFS transporter